jgi:prepilin-type N-terminal cleavage/methylation domain-containing protein
MARVSSIRRRAGGFTLVEILVVIGILAILMGVLLGALGAFMREQKVRRAKMVIHTLEMCLAQYNTDFNSYPPDNGVSTNGSEILAYYLGQRFTLGQSFKGPYYECGNCPDRDGNGLKEIYSPLGGSFEYRLRIDSRGQVRGFTLVDPGFDKLLGGSIDPQNGFQESNKSEAADNIYSDETIH